MKKRWFVKGVTGLLVAGMVVSMAACGSAHKTASMDMMAVQNNGGEAYYDNAMEYDYAASDMEMPEAASDGGIFDDFTNKGTAEDISQTAASNQKLIRTVSMDVETEQFDELIGQIEEKTKALGGYIEDSYTYNGRSYRSNDTKNANLTIRIPSVRLDEFLSAVSDQSNVTSKNETVTDVTLQYVDLESHKKALEAEQERLLEMIEQAETVEDMITIESRLSEVRYQLESQESQLRTFDNQIQYSTVCLIIAEVEKYTPVAERTFFEKISDGFTDNLAGVAEDLVNFVIWFISSLPYLVVWGIIIAIAVKLIGKGIRDKKERKERGIDKKTQKAERKAKKAEKKAAKKAGKAQKPENEAANVQKAEVDNVLNEQK